MVKLVALFRRPQDPTDWMNRFLTETTPLVRQLPNLTRVELASPFDTMSGADRRGAPFLMAELYFDSRADFDAAIAAPEGRWLVENLDSLAGRDVTMFLADVEREEQLS